jgi:hypothetical protein
MNYLRRVDPMIPVGHPDYKWTSGADVQKTWRKYGWEPVFGNTFNPILPKEQESPSFMRRFK